MNMKNGAYLLLGLLGGMAMMAGIEGVQAAPESEGDASMRVFELRTYHTNPGKLDALHARFRDHTNALFVKHGIKLIGYWTPSEGESAANTLVYMIAHDSRDAAKASWMAFGADPAWQEAKAASEVDGKLVERVESVYLRATDYSPIQ